MSQHVLWERLRRSVCVCPSIGLRLDFGDMGFDESSIKSMQEPITRALSTMRELERGAIANASENRMVGHYWLRAPELAPTPVIAKSIDDAVEQIKVFAVKIHEGEIRPQRSEAFYIVLLVGIGGSALGPQFLAQALGKPDDPMMIRFLDNTDPDGIARTLAEMEEMLDQTLTIVVSKSGGTAETRNGMLEAAAAYRRAGLNFSRHAVAITCGESLLDQKAKNEDWLASFPIWDWVGGRCSIASAVGLLPLALIGADVDQFLAGAHDCDVATRAGLLKENPAAILAATWHHAGNGIGNRNMIVMPYRDRLELFPRYLQQLIMESIGKRTNRRGEVVHQGLNVFGNKGSTDQHSFVQQLRDGRSDFFVTFVDAIRDSFPGEQVWVDADVTSGDYLHGFLCGTREALREASRPSMTITVDAIDERSIGALIALFERAVGLYAELIDVNAYDQPGVEAGKKAAGRVLQLQSRVIQSLRSNSSRAYSASELAVELKVEDMEIVWRILEHLAASSAHSIKSRQGATIFNNQYFVESSDPKT
ncbi:MAG: glucose-6-phosphate isomerase [Planctomycetes bacterium]|nr:glucose-6-phosphate isomerase [Planctomycetota bacterium]MBI3836188.1 glucose-6-phosphate isomerase [Planctomycetota bacterium]